MTDFLELLKKNPYPGRGIMLGRSACGGKIFISYFIMGRSENSRNRIFVMDGGALRTKAFEESKMTDPSLVIYYPLRVCGDTTVVTNGDQTDTICDHIAGGGTFESALRTREYEPDDPNFTPRISGILFGDGSYKLSILKRDEGGECGRFFYEYGGVSPGIGRFISTYSGDGEILPSFSGEPVTVALPEDLKAFSGEIWGSMNQDNKVSLFTREIDLASGKTADLIFNKHGEAL